MRKKVFFVIQILIATVGLFAKQITLDETIALASETIKEEHPRLKNPKYKLAIYDFELPAYAKTEEMSVYIRDGLTRELRKLEINPVTRDLVDGAMLDKELESQHESGKFRIETIKDVATKCGADLIVYGKVTDEGDEYLLTLRILESDEVNPLLYKFKPSHQTEQLLGIGLNKKVAQGFGAEINKNSLAFVAPAASVSFDYNIPKKVSLGFKIFASWDMYEKNNNFITLEPLASLRFYLVSHGGKPGTGVFLEILGGVSILSINSDIQFGANAGAGYGYRFAFGNFYIEPEIRVGYPYIAGAGISTGFRF